MILMYHNENVTLPVRHNKHEHSCMMHDAPISLHNIVELSLALRNHDHAITLVLRDVSYVYSS